MIVFHCFLTKIQINVKHLLLILCILFAFGGYSQNLVVKSKSAYQTKQTLIKHATATKYTYNDSIVYKSKNGKIFVPMKSKKTGNWYPNYNIELVSE